MAEPALAPETQQGPSKGGLDAPAFAAKAAPTAGVGAESPGAGGVEGPLPMPAAPLRAPEISGAAPSTPARTAPLSAAPPSPIAAMRPTAGEAAAAPASPRRNAAGRMPPIAYGGLATLITAVALTLLLTPRLVGMGMFHKDASDPFDAQLTQLLRLNSGAKLAGAGMVVALAAAAAGRWGSPDTGVSDLLRAGLVGQGAATLALLFAYVRVIPPISWLAVVGRQLGRTLAPRSGSLLAGAHFLLALLFPASGFLLAVAPWFTLYHFWGYSYGKAAFLLARLAGFADLLIVPIAQLALKSFAERGALASPAVRALNIGVLLAALIHTAVELRMVAGAPAGFLLPVNLSTWVFAGLTSAASLVAGGRPADLVAEMKEVAEGVKKKE
ncbi:Meiotic nuclear division 1 [Chlorella sorokiniana]|uniref:Meiotic nuclear division 1 n=1 Tax=Chlorella sorokiniana TaxID=3076 RepID=A0A2P6TK71_CHLSO|nr:Meiotic nuclear division 1 [Chlorella sorokiniana]|eukprot:PRW44480.1 Meiotic nuclear division 1 [Chlorella sorokiniana]